MLTGDIGRAQEMGSTVMVDPIFALLMDPPPLRGELALGCATQPRELARG